MEQKTGRVLRCIGGFYYVETADAVYECRGRGALRREGLSPVAGDFVTVSVSGDGTGALETVLPRRNSLVRPPVANLDCLAIVVSVTDPLPNTLVIDKLIATAEQQEITPVLLIGKTDLGSPEELAAVYRQAGFAVFCFCAATGEGVAEIKVFLQGKVTVFTGNSGVGKSSLLNRLQPDLRLETGETSKKLGRGRHTTRSACLYPVGNGTYFADTPGFSSLEMGQIRLKDPQQLPFLFREFEPYLLSCRFTSCAHTKEAGCAVREAVEAGCIARSRYESYVQMWESVKDYRLWQEK